MLAKILIKERENSAQLTDCDTNYIGEGLYYLVYGGKKILVLRDGCEVLRRKNSHILKRSSPTSSFSDPLSKDRNVVSWEVKYEV